MSAFIFIQFISLCCISSHLFHSVYVCVVQNNFYYRPVHTAIDQPCTYTIYTCCRWFAIHLPLYICVGECNCNMQFINVSFYCSFLLAAYGRIAKAQCTWSECVCFRVFVTQKYDTILFVLRYLFFGK